ncbi:unnamed protein product [Plutella xylostella]|uniref:(diamondback moth) hypothetical protein n=1 Tax=Plutella xylostella TaxID=51655 RepID=A0A8S4FJC2_PLUXY|nr:unnamed protein product [Plutella xylostella]
MGLEIAKDFARRGAKVIIVCPFDEEGRHAKNLIEKETENKNVVFMNLDLGSFKSVRKFAEIILLKEYRLDILVNNAGVGIPGDFFTDDGLNFIMQVNFFGHFLLTVLLLPLLMKSAHSRIVNTSSVLHRFGEMDLKRLNSSGYYYLIQLYCNSKFCMIPFARALKKRLQGSGVVVNCVDPGLVGTRIWSSGRVPLVGHILTIICNVMFKTPMEGAQTAIHVAVDENAVSVSGELFKDCKIIKATTSAYSDKVADELWEESIKLVKLSQEELSFCE